MGRSNGVRAIDNPAIISLEADFSISEGIGSRPITVTRTGNTTGTTIVPYFVVPMTAGIADYTTAATGTLTFAPSDSVKTIANSIVDDLLVEPTEQYRFELGADDTTWIRGKNTCLISIIDNDSSANPNVTSVSSPIAAEGANLVFTITLSATTTAQISYAFTITGTATAGLDYAIPLTFSNGITISGSNLVLPAGISSFTATTLTITDALVEPTETVILTIGGITGTGSITDASTITPITRMAVFETPYGMLSAAQQTAIASNGGYFTACAARSDATSDNYAIDISTTGINGTYTRYLDNLSYSPYAEVVNSLPFKHPDIIFVNAYDLPATLTANTIGLMVDDNGLNEFGLYSNYVSQTFQGATATLFIGTKNAIFDTVPINLNNTTNAKVYLLNNLAQDTTLRSNGAIIYVKFVAKKGAVAYSGAVTPIAVTITGRANKPLGPRNVQFGYDGGGGLDFYSYPSFQFPRADLTFKIDTASRAETTPSGFFTPSGLNEASTTYEMDILGADGFIRTVPITLSTTNTAVYTLNTRENVDREYGITTYNFYAVKGGVRSLPYSFDLTQDVRIIPNVTAASAVVSGANVNITVTLNSTNSSPFAIDYFLGGTVFTTQAFGTITCTNGVTLLANQRLQVPPSISSFVMTVPTVSASGKTLTTSWGADQQFATSSTL